MCSIHPLPSPLRLRSAERLAFSRPHQTNEVLPGLLSFSSQCHVQFAFIELFGAGRVSLVVSPPTSNNQEKSAVICAFLEMARIPAIPCALAIVFLRP
jgi:hypothetical protein